MLQLLELDFFGILEPEDIENIIERQLGESVAKLPEEIETQLNIYESYRDLTGREDFIYSDGFRKTTLDLCYIGMAAGYSATSDIEKNEEKRESCKNISQRALYNLSKLLEIQKYCTTEMDMSDYKDGLEAYLQYEDQYLFEKKKREDEKKNNVTRMKPVQNYR